MEGAACSNANSFKLRGTPKVGAFIENNVFPRATGDVIGTDGRGTIGLYVGPNRDKAGFVRQVWRLRFAALKPYGMYAY